MTDDTSNREDASRIAEIRNRWEQFDNTGDESLIVDHLAEEVTVLPPGGEPIVGKPAVVDTLAAFPTNAYDVEHTEEDTVMSGDLAVDYVSVEGVKLDEDGDVGSEVSLKGIDVYQRGSADSWNLLYSMWNDQA